MRFLVALILIVITYCEAFSQDSIKTSDSLIFGKATYYGRKFNGRKTASGERYSNKAYTAAHASFPFKTKIRVTNTLNNKQVDVVINDRCRRKNKNVVDLSYIAAKDIEMLGHGVIPISYYVLYPNDSINRQDSISKIMQSEK